MEQKNGKPRNFPAGIYAHKKGWMARFDGKRVVFAGKTTPHEEVLSRYYMRMAVSRLATLRPAPETTHHAPAPASKTPLPPVQVPVIATGHKSSLTVPQLKEKYIEHKTQLWRGGEFANRSLMSVKEVLPRFADAYPVEVSTLTATDFSKYRASLADRYEPHTLNRHVTQIRAMFTWAFRNYIIPELPRWGDGFEKPSAETLRKHTKKVRALNGKKLFTADQIQKLLAMADPRMKALILLGVNCAVGNRDVAWLPISSLDLKLKVLDSPRLKTGEERRAILWPETVEAVKDWLKVRPTAADAEHDGLLFLTPSGTPMVQEDPLRGKNGVRTDSVSETFGNLIDKAKLKQKGRCYYSLRHTFYTIASQTGDMHAVSLSAGHALGGMADTYCQSIGDDRLKKVSYYVRKNILKKAKSQAPPSFGEVERLVIWE